jgi:hypothetical protein
MGAWGTGSFDNGDALDLVGRLDRYGIDALKEALDEVTNVDPDGYLHAPEASSAIAAAEVVAAGLDGMALQLPEPAQAWLAEHHESVVTPSLVALARRAVERALVRSELRELWEESAAQSEQWASGVRELIKRLDAGGGRVSKRKARQRPSATKIAFEAGAVLRVDIDNEWHTYARMLVRRSKIAFYDCRVATAVENLRDIVQRPVLFVVDVRDDAYDKGRWPRVGHVPLGAAPIPIPNEFMQSIGTGKCRIVDKDFNIRPATPEECVGPARARA